MTYEIDEPQEQQEPQEPQVEQIEQEVEQASSEPEQIESQEPEQTPLPDWAVKAVNKKHYLWKEEERKTKALEAELEQLRKQIPAQQEQIKKPNYYDYDNDDDFNAALEKYAADKALNAQRQAQEAIYNNQLEQHRQQQAIKQHQEAVEAERRLIESAKKSNVSESELYEAAAIVGSYGLGQSFATRLMTLDNAPLIIKQLAANPMELERLAGMDDYEKGVYVATRLQSTRKTTSAPKPPSDISGGAHKPSKYQNIKNATFE